MRGRVVHFPPEMVLAHAAKRFLPARTNRCPKCGSGFVVHEPAFVHCCYCGAMARIASGSLLAQELFELRLGLRLAS
jgi:hypothetical protein